MAYATKDQRHEYMVLTLEGREHQEFCGKCSLRSDLGVRACHATILSFRLNIVNVHSVDDAPRKVHKLRGERGVCNTPV